MNLDKYELKVSDNYISYRFKSIGKNGTIDKGIIFTYIEEIGIWNLGFRDIDKETNEICDLAVSDNGDSEKILATVAFATLFFIENYPNAIIFAEGNTPTRNRLYRIGISKHFEEISKTFIVKGLLNDKWLDFEKNTDYQAFVIRKNYNKFEQLM